MRFEKEDDYVEITHGMSANTNGSVWFIESSLDFKDLPVEFRKQVPKIDHEGFEKLKNAVLSWINRKGFKLVPKT